ncbi:MAG: substrate-binding domain-containing protein, partial [Lachnospiraceae bacterium]
YMTKNNPFFEILDETLDEVIESNGDILISRDPCQDQEKQNQQIEEMIEEGIEILFLNPVDWKSVEPALQACKNAGVVVINIDTAVYNRELVVSYIETDNYKAGALCALDMINRIEKAKILIINNPIQTSITNRVQGFLDIIEGKEEYEIIYSIDGAGEIEVGAEVMSNFLKNGQEINVILGGNDPSALGALSALQQNGKEEGILIYGIDGSPDFKAMIELEYVTGTSSQSPKTIAEVAAKTAYSYLNGENIEEYISIEPIMITKENLDLFEINGWQ